MGVTMNRAHVFVVIGIAAFGVIEAGANARTEFKISLEPYKEHLEYRLDPIAARVSAETMECWVISTGSGLSETLAGELAGFVITNEKQPGYPNSYEMTGYPTKDTSTIVVLVSQNTTAGVDLFMLAVDSTTGSISKVWAAYDFRVPYAAEFETIPLSDSQGSLAFGFVATDARGGRQLTVVDTAGEERVTGVSLMDLDVVEHDGATAIVAKSAKWVGPAECPEGFQSASCAEIEVATALYSAGSTRKGLATRTVVGVGSYGYVLTKSLPDIDASYSALSILGAPSASPSMPDGTK
jgi:hypothetical protein